MAPSFTAGPTIADVLNFTQMTKHANCCLQQPRRRCCAFYRCRVGQEIACKSLFLHLAKPAIAYPQTLRQIMNKLSSRPQSLHTASSASLRQEAWPLSAAGSLTITITIPKSLQPFVASTPAARAASALPGRHLQLCSCCCCPVMPMLPADIGRCPLVLLLMAVLPLTLRPPPASALLSSSPAGSGMASATSGSLHRGQRAPSRLQWHEANAVLFTTNVICCAVEYWLDEALAHLRSLTHGILKPVCLQQSYSSVLFHLLCARLYRQSLHVPWPHAKRSHRLLSGIASRQTGHSSAGCQAAASASLSGAARSRSAVGTHTVVHMANWSALRSLLADISQSCHLHVLLHRAVTFRLLARLRWLPVLS